MKKIIALTLVSMISTAQALEMVPSDALIGEVIFHGRGPGGRPRVAKNLRLKNIDVRGYAPALFVREKYLKTVDMMAVGGWEYRGPGRAPRVQVVRADVFVQGLKKQPRWKLHGLNYNRDGYIDARKGVRAITGKYGSSFMASIDKKALIGKGLRNGALVFFDLIVRVNGRLGRVALTGVAKNPMRLVIWRL